MLGKRLSLPAAGGGTLLSSLAGAQWTVLDTSIRASAVLVAVVLTAAAAQISVPVPFTPVPLTFQPMVVLLAGAALGPRLGLLSQVIYLAAGVAGLPVFAASPVLLSGAARLLGPTGGYLLSYPFAAWLTGRLAERGLDRRYLTAVLAMLAGLVVIYAVGVAWLAWLAWPLPGAGPETVRPGLRAAVAAGLAPFVLLDLAKVAVAAAVLPACWKLVGRLD